MTLLIDIAGWLGSVFILLAYGLNSYKKIESNSMKFYLLNFFGGILLIIYSTYKEAFANTFINIVWVLIAIPAIVNLVRSKK
jgi:hypothetical protein